MRFLGRTLSAEVLFSALGDLGLMPLRSVAVLCVASHIRAAVSGEKHRLEDPLSLLMDDEKIYLPWRTWDRGLC